MPSFEGWVLAFMCMHLILLFCLVSGIYAISGKLQIIHDHLKPLLERILIRLTD